MGISSRVVIQIAWLYSTLKIPHTELKIFLPYIGSESILTFIPVLDLLYLRPSYFDEMTKIFFADLFLE